MNIDIFLLSETWLKSHIPDNFINDKYKIFRNDREHRGGGVLIGVQQSIKCLKYDIITEFECICVEIFNRDKKYLLVSLYIPPNYASNLLLLEKLKIFLKNFEKADKFETILIAGDLNIDFNQSNFAAKISHIFHFYGFSQLVKENTHNKSLIDLVFVKNNKIKNLEVVENISPNCDHKAIILT